MPASVHTALGIDVDFYTGPISRTVWNRVKAADQKFVIAQAWGGRSRNEYAVSQLAGARAVGLKTAAYVLLNYDDKVCPTFAHPVRNEHGRCAGDPIPQDEPGGRWQVRQGAAALGSELDKVSFIAIDVEWFASPAPSLDAAEQERRRQSILDAIGEVKRLRKQAVIYTRNANGHWSDITGCRMTDSAAECADLYKLIHNPAAPIALWDVQDGTPDLDNFRPHGAWNERLGRQYKLDRNLFGLPAERTVDLNVFDISLFTPRTTLPPKAKKLSRKGRAAAAQRARRNS
jgi:hypothetical protein